MRGTPKPCLEWMLRCRIIPAYAGNTRACAMSESCSRDHPRVCGEHICRDVAGFAHMGSSPRMRGTRMSDNVESWRMGIIPAYAGNTFGVSCGIARARDHPRVCGEHMSVVVSTFISKGSSPRMRGTLHPCLQHAIHTWDHPRVCGEHTFCSVLSFWVTGSSPRMRGTQRSEAVNAPRAGIIPAYAGNTLRDYSNFVVSKFMSFVFHLV